MLNNFIYNETEGIIFDYENKYALGQCISADFDFKAGLAKVYDARYGVRASLQEIYGKGNWQSKGHCLVSNGGNIFNFVVKDKYWMKTTYDRLEEAFEDCRRQMKAFGVTGLAIPRLGNGMDELEWQKVHDIIFRVFDGSNLEIRVVYINEYIDGAIVDADMEKNNYKKRDTINGETGKKYY